MNGCVGTASEHGVVVTPQLIIALMDVEVAKVSCGGMHSAAVDKSQQLWVWGSNAYGQLGLSAETESVKEPILQPDATQCHSVSCGAYHTAVLVDISKISDDTQ